VSETSQEVLEQFCNDFENARNFGFSKVAKAIRAVLAQVKQWEREEIKRASCCSDNEERADKAEAECATLRAELAASRHGDTTPRTRYLEAKVERLRHNLRAYGDGKICRAHGEWHPDCTDAMLKAEVGRLKFEAEKQGCYACPGLRHRAVKAEAAHVACEEAFIRADKQIRQLGADNLSLLWEKQRAEAALKQSEAEVARMIAVVGRASQYRKQAEATLLRVNAALARNIDYQEKVHAVIAALRDTTPGQFRV